jgi:glycine dehydrogenase subunit 1
MPHDAKAAYQRMVGAKIVAGLPLAPHYPELAGHYLLCATETSSRADIDALVEEVTR